MALPDEFASLFPPEEPTPLTEDGQKLKRQIYESMSPRRRKFIDRIGYEQWDPFQEPKEPLDLRRDRTNRTLQELIGDFLKDAGGDAKDQAWRKGVMECALGIIKKDARFQGVFDFCLWYHKQLRKENEE